MHTDDVLVQLRGRERERVWSAVRKGFHVSCEFRAGRETECINAACSILLEMCCVVNDDDQTDTDECQFWYYFEISSKLTALLLRNCATFAAR